MTTSEHPTFIYTLADPRNDVVRYIGYTRNLKKRLAAHMLRNRGDCHRMHWIYSLLDMGKEPVIEILETCIPEEDYKIKEIEWIAAYKHIGFDLVNDTVGGDGNNTARTSEWRKKISMANAGRVFSQESCNKMSRAHMGKSHSQETRDKMSHAGTGKILGPQSQEHRDKLSLAHIGIPQSQETRDKRSDALLAYWKKRKDKK